MLPARPPTLLGTPNTQLSAAPGGLLSALIAPLSFGGAQATKC